MRSPVITDTGPLVALLNSKDKYHEWVVQQFENLRTPLHTCESVISETCFVLRGYPKAVDALFELRKRKLLAIQFSLESEWDAVRTLMAKYSNVPMSVADACLVRMTELKPNHLLFTLDRDFTIYRKAGRQVIPTVMPES